jgi:hypothetical protein
MLYGMMAKPPTSDAAKMILNSSQKLLIIFVILF